jgi:hypothetical protein
MFHTCENYMSLLCWDLLPMHFGYEGLSESIIRKLRLVLCRNGTLRNPLMKKSSTEIVKLSPEPVRLHVHLLRGNGVTLKFVWYIN